MLLDPPTTHPAPVRPAASIRSTPTNVVTVESLPPPTVGKPTTPRPPLWQFGLAAAVLAWAFFPTLDWLVEKWTTDPSYSHGFLVPFVAAYMVYRKRGSVTEWFGAPRPLAAAGVFAAVFALRGLAGGLLFNQLDALAFLLSLAAAVLAVGGWRLVRNLAPGLAFLVFFVPLPYELEQNVGGPLKVIATASSTFLLQTLGFPAVATGNIIRIDDVELGVVDACNGLKMLLTFAAIGGGAVLLLNRTWFEKFLIVLGVVPIALVANVLRITATGVIFALGVRDKHTQEAVHDGLGYAMPVIGIGLFYLELWVLNRLVVKPDTTPLSLGGEGLGVRG